MIICWQLGSGVLKVSTQKASELLQIIFPSCAFCSSRLWVSNPFRGCTRRSLPLSGHVDKLFLILKGGGQRLPHTRVLVEPVLVGWLMWAGTLRIRSVARALQALNWISTSASTGSSLSALLASFSLASAGALTWPWCQGMLSISHQSSASPQFMWADIWHQPWRKMKALRLVDGSHHVRVFSFTWQEFKLFRMSRKKWKS